MSSSVFKNIDTLCLASASPRRRLLAEEFGLNVKILSAGAEEIPGTGSPEEIAAGLAYQKAEAVLKQYSPGPREVILTADTSVWLGGRIFGKPSDAHNARAMLRLLSGAEHEVITGCVLAYRNPDNTGGAHAVNTLSFSAVTRVMVDVLTDEEIEAYIDSGDPFDKAGAYGIQGVFAVHVSRIDGCYNNVVGLPVNEVYKRLKKIDKVLQKT